jgi:hypothetical protein
MKNSTKKGKGAEEVAGKAIEESQYDEMNEIREFIRKKQLQNQVLKKLSEDLDQIISQELNKPKSA